MLVHVLMFWLSAKGDTQPIHTVLFVVSANLALISVWTDSADLTPIAILEKLHFCSYVVYAQLWVSYFLRYDRGEFGPLFRHCDSTLSVWVIVLAHPHYYILRLLRITRSSAKLLPIADEEQWNRG